ncbi:UDP-glycosyltransferase 73B4 [Dichanthelium oligosanthes]|uniref:UDP-glycosyltransferase 73B4 n=1 Tax=Dichanthelium oligosanthes TaxID=888268 RepID=A0A1E5V4Q4_9POAL|nr:UDP-glycosyltransferase 73B4 [Dichanthelium oligosanthes]
MAATADTARPAAPAGSGGRDHVVVFPLMAKGHMLPLFHFAAALVARHSLRVTVVTTPGNLAFARRSLPEAAVGLVALPFPAHPDLPTGLESKDDLPSLALFPLFLRATALLREPLAGYLASLPAPPLAIVSDFFLGFTQRVASDAGVPRVTFHGMSTFALALWFSLERTPPPPAESVEGGGAPFRVSGFPEGVTITKDDVPDGVGAQGDDPFSRFMADEVFSSEYRSWGVLVNSFDALDGEYAAPLESLYHPGARAWLAGPLFLAAGFPQEEDGEDDDPEGCLPWLDEQAAKRPGSVVYVSLATYVHVTDAQLDELAHGLVDSGHAFLWAVQSSDSGNAWSPPVDAGPDGRIVRGCIPHRRVLAHPAVGAFVSHCGWDAILESLAAGRPMLAWPGIAEQDMNAKQVAEILGAGVRVGVKAGSDELVCRAHLAEKVRELMDGGEDGRRMRARAEDIERAAHAAVGEGGTTRLALRRLVEELQRSYDGGDGRRSDEQRQ